jgi:hypothetical protein
VGSAALNDLVELAAVEPHTPTLGAIVKLDTLALGHGQQLIDALRTFHGSLL